MASPGLNDADRRAIVELCQRYALFADNGDFEAMGALFAKDGELVSPRGATAGRAAITRAFGGLDRYDRTFHLLGQLRQRPVESDAEAARGDAAGEVYCVAHHFTGSADRIMYIRYHDIYRRDENGDGWTFAVRRLEVVADGDQNLV